MFLRFGFYFSLPYSDLTGNKLFFFPQVESVLPVTVILSDLPVLISTQEPFVIFSLPCPVEEGSDRAVLVGMLHPARVNPPQ